MVLARVEYQVVNLRSRILALERQLPSPEVIQKATATASSLRTQVDEASTRVAALWAALFAVLQQAEAAARDVAATLGVGRAAAARLTDLIRGVGLNEPLPVVPGPPSVEAKVAGLQAALLRDVVYAGVIDPTTERDLTAALEARTREQAAQAPLVVEA